MDETLPTMTPVRLYVLIAAVVVAALVATGAAVAGTFGGAGGVSFGDWRWLIVLAVAAAVAQLFPVLLTRRGQGEEVNLDEVVCAAVFLILSPAGAWLAMVAAACAAALIRRKRLVKTLLNLSAGVLATTAGLVAVDLVHGPAGSPTSARQLLAVGVGVLVWSVTLTGLVWGAISAATGEPMGRVARDGAAFSAVAMPLALAWGLIAAVAMREVPWTTVLAVAPVVLLWDLQRASNDRALLRRLLDAAMQTALSVNDGRVAVAIEKVGLDLLGATTRLVAQRPADHAISTEVGHSATPRWLVVEGRHQLARWKRGDQAVLDAVGAIAGIALDNAEFLLATREQAERDPLTRLANRTTLERILTDAVAGHRAGLLFVDIDRFKRINDSLGHHIGDAVLQGVAERLRLVVAGRGVVCRMGGDEFAVVCPCLTAPELVDLAAEIVEQMRPALHVEELELHLTASVGAAHQSDDGATAAALLRAAGLATNTAKTAGRDRLQRAQGDRDVQDMLQLEAELRDAVREQNLHVVYQPVLDVAGAIEGAEALVRWAHPRLGPIPPDRFLPLAEECGLISQIDLWVMATAVRQISAWQSSGGPRLRVGVNMSGTTLSRAGTEDHVLDLLDRHGANPALLEIEITEQIATHEPEVVIDRLRRLREHGITIAIDDFGVGFSSLSRLQTFPVDRVKIDRSFLRPTDGGDDPSPIVSATIALAHRLGLKVTAEGVEHHHQLRYLQEQGCDAVQGFLFSPGIPAVTLTERFVRPLPTSHTGHGSSQSRNELVASPLEALASAQPIRGPV